MNNENKVNEKTFDISNATGDVEMPTRSEKNGKGKKQEKKKKSKSGFWSNLLTFIGLAGILIGGAILGTTLWNEFQRGEQTKELIEEARSIVSEEKLITRDEFNPQVGDVVGLLVIPKDNVKVAIIEGMRDADLHAGVGHEPLTGWPTDQRQIFLAGHRNTEFGVLEHIQDGDVIEMHMKYGTFIYKVSGTKIVPDTATEEIKPTEFFENDQLVLMTCYPFTFGADTKERFLVFAERV